MKLPQIAPMKFACAFLFAAAVISSRAAPLVIDVSYPVIPVKQPSTMSCWAAATTMLITWKELQPLPLPILAVVQRGGDKYVDIFVNNKGISPTDESAFYKALNLSVIQGQNPAIQTWADLLRKKGPLSVTVDADPGKGFIHALVVTGLKGDGTAGGTEVTYIDPASGKTEAVAFSKFLTLYEGSAQWPLQIISAK